MKSLFFIFLMVVGCGVAVGLTREYIFFNYYYSWYSAQSYCRQYYRDLATITSNEENEQLLRSGPSYYESWIGLTMLYTSTWTWSDGEPALLQKWNEGSPYFSLRNEEFCGAINSNGFWINHPYWYGHPFYCYRFLILVKEKKTWEEAQEFCRTNYTGLASVTSKTSLKQLNLETVGTETESVWTGLRFMDGQWFWESGEQLGSLVSMPSCPALSYRCGALNTTTNTLMNQNCNEKMNFVCYW
ncbi:macrophage mannose receptor 1-like isoform X3 [Hemibagrus wyckioides]|uniref:macrophage mannose receptor 1-like isoform X3 n=1 Tax=Hemibagrus wyckioides TaxID=337641 RepID=UPI00266D118D|nr:macrophage mannose receptor 1-like isoform X3 [Hemibagrus wyckioides]